MPLSPSPDLRSSRRLVATAAVATLCVLAMLVWKVHRIAGALGDTDDAMRLVMVRELLGGRGWYDQVIWRLQPPHGVFLHWSRLVDGGIGALMAGLRLFLPLAQAELWTRLVWPLLWIFPVVLSGLAIAAHLGKRSAVFVCAILLVMDIALFVQFRPGRIDHHNIQITLAVAALACALVQGEARARWAVLAGLTAALGLTIGIEALAFQALVGASYGLGLILDRRTAPAARAYGLSLAGGALALFALSTPPDRWGLPFCDALGLNLIATIVVSGLGLAGVASFAERLSPRVRIGLVLAVGVVAACIYVSADPACLRGPFGSVDPRVRPFWFDHIQELNSWPVLFNVHRNEAVHSMVIGALGALAAVWLVIRGWRTPARGELLLAACTAVAVVAEAKAYRMEDYGLWFGTPALAIALADLVAAFLADKLLAAGLLAVILSPTTVGDVAILAVSRQPKPPPRPADHCYETRSYARLAHLPVGVVVSEPDLGPLVLANSPQSAMSAPYHRMTWGILAAHDALGLPPATAEAALRALHTTYVLDCPAHYLRQPAGSVAANIRSGHAPAWLEPLSGPNEPLKVYRLPPAPNKGRP